MLDAGQGLFWRWYLIKWGFACGGWDGFMCGQIYEMELGGGDYNIRFFEISIFSSDQFFLAPLFRRQDKA